MTTDELTKRIWNLLKEHGCNSFLFALHDPDSDYDIMYHSGSTNWIVGAGYRFAQYCPPKSEPIIDDSDDTKEVS